jgi:hypothetical protein
MNKLILPSIILTIISITIPFKSISQEIAFDPDSILVGDRNQPEIFLVGSFHFSYYNLDAHKTDKDKQVDILSVQKQIELNELVEYIAQFKPTKIAIESSENTTDLMRKYRNYQRDTSLLGRGEAEQIGFRLMKKFQLDTIYGVDANGIYQDMAFADDSAAFRKYLSGIFNGYDYKSDDPISKLYSKYYDFKDSLYKELSLLKIFKLNNSDKILDRGFGAYLNGDFKLGDTEGADALALYWYSRNLKIYRKIQQITTSPDDRVLVIFGAGHIQILKHLFQCSPEYNLIKFNEMN